MPGLDTSIPLQVNTGNPLQTLSQMAGLANTAQSMQSRALAMQAQRNENAISGMRAQEMQAVTPFLSDVKNYTDENGNLDNAKALNGVMSLAPNTGTDIYKNLLSAQAQRAQLSAALMQNDTTANSKMGQVLAGIDPTQTTAQDIGKLKDTYLAMNPNIPPTSAQAVDKVFGNAASIVSNDSLQPEIKQHLLTNIARQFSPVETQQGMANAQHTITTDNNGNVIDVARNPATGAVSGAMNVAQSAAIPAGETPQSRNDLIANRTQVQQAAMNTNTQHDYNRTALNMLTDPEFTNPKTAWGQIKSKYGNLVGSDYNSTLDQIAHNVALNTQLNEKSMNVNTDAGRQTAAVASGNVQMTPQALANAIRMSDASATGVAAYAKANEAAIGPNGNIYAQRKLQSDWAQNYHPQLMMLHNAIQNGDAETKAKIAAQAQLVDQSYLGTGKAFGGAKDLADKAKAIDSLIKTGQIQGP